MEDDFINEWRRKRINQLKMSGERRVPPVEIVVLTSKGCIYCPIAVRIMKIAKKQLGDAVNLREIDISTPMGIKLARKYNIMGVPAVIIEDTLAFMGVPPSPDAVIERVNELREIKNR